jgi:hypothetical protein
MTNDPPTIWTIKLTISQKDFPEDLYSTKWFVSRRVRVLLQSDCQPPKMDGVKQGKVKGKLVNGKQCIYSENAEKNGWELGDIIVKERSSAAPQKNVTVRYFRNSRKPSVTVTDSADATSPL